MMVCSVDWVVQSLLNHRIWKRLHVEIQSAGVLLIRKAGVWIMIFFVPRVRQSDRVWAERKDDCTVPLLQDQRGSQFVFHSSAW